MNKIIGDNFENYVLKLKQQIDPSSKIWLWDKIPWSMMVECGLVKNTELFRQNRETALKNKRKNSKRSQSNIMDRGIDILEKKDDGTFVAIQCKCGYEKGLHFSHLSTFYAYVSFCSKPLLKEVYHTSKVSAFLLEHATDENKFIKVNNYVADPVSKIDDELSNELSNELSDEDKPIENDNVLNEELIIFDEIETYDIRDYQVTRIEQLKEHFKTEKRGIMDMPPGTGKTFMSAHCANEFRITIMLSPLKQHALENMNRFKKYFPKMNAILVDSDSNGTRDPEHIYESIKSCKNNIMLSSTYKSVDIILKLLEDYID